ncbi:isocitrate dehydrogenase kinase/phosphatase [Yersinia similis]|uniref:Isocitrate dehydrogenase kinase/phosphatase n=1 Tax=Yersinia similis TaxID=367190 RepID=A0A0T9R5R8_9GAMM|nr:isocitrate dehydrogenase kinase/phosphatase [Yersinia similis]CNG29910.1 isocitrate dehydrogenase kinase/phosphatase [Yersinia similis]CNI45620.1 isocitrate dehydrogenase kinase/phosphatase [Yersinia similis]
MDAPTLTASKCLNVSVKTQEKERPYMAARAYMDVLTASLLTAYSLRYGHFVNNLSLLM